MAVPLVSSRDSTFNYDFGVSFTKEDIAAGRAIYDYDTPIRSSEDMHGTSIFAKDDAGAIYHTYSTYGRGAVLQLGAFMWLDLTPKGRNEVGGFMSWLRLHDAYASRPAADACCQTEDEARKISAKKPRKSRDTRSDTAGAR